MTDREKLAALATQLGVDLDLPYKYHDDKYINRATYDEQGHLIKLFLNELNLIELPPEIGEFIHLQELRLAGNQLTDLPNTLSQLIQLKGLWLGSYVKIKNELIELGNALNHVPTVICLLTSLQQLDISNNKITTIPDELQQLTKLEWLYLDNNQITKLPIELCYLTDLERLDLSNNPLTMLPTELEKLTKLEHLYLRNNQLSVIPFELGQLTQLKRLLLNNNQLTKIPIELGQLKNLEWLWLHDNPLTILPTELWQLTNLTRLILHHTFLTYLPIQISNLTNLIELSVNNTLITHLPIELANLTNLKELNVANNPLRTPPPEIATQGIDEIMDFMRDLQRGHEERHEAKLLLVGEGAAGKTSLLRALRHETFDPHLSTTHGIEIKELELEYRVGEQTQTQTPNSNSNSPLKLHMWDFGGQHIYQSTHQFFLTERSLYVLVWNARVDVEQAALDRWLKNIQILAPQSPVLLVATHGDERAADVNYPALQKRYPQLAGNFTVSSKTGQGLPELKQALAEQARQLPLMGQLWPSSWVAAEQALLNRPDHHLNLDDYLAICEAHGVKREIARTTFGGYLHDLGKVLYFQQDDLLSQLVILKPNWITKAMGYVLTDEPTRQALGRLDHAALARIWQLDDEGIPYQRAMFPIFLRLMERFELSYQLEAETIGQATTHSLVPLLLPFQPPADLPAWPVVPPIGQTQVEMIYRLDFMPPGLLPRFIVRTHRYTTQRHWREGCMLVYEGHMARVELDPQGRTIHLLVQGVLPENFFSILRNTIEEILAFFKGLTIRRDMPCICHWAENAAPCPRFYSYDDLVKRMQKGRYEVECPDSFSMVSVPKLLYGIHPSTQPQMIADIQQIKSHTTEMLALQHETLTRLQQQSQLIARNFARQWNFFMQRELDLRCPNQFVIVPTQGSRFNPKNWVSQSYELYLLCQDPQHMHTFGEPYPLRQSAEWWAKISPWLGHLLTLLKYGIPLGKLTEAIAKDTLDQIESATALMEQMNSAMPAITQDLDDLEESRLQFGHEFEPAGPALRAFHTFLKAADPHEFWRGLHWTPTPDGTVLWLCPRHYEPYRPKLLVMPDEV